MTPKEAARARFLERFSELKLRFEAELVERLSAIETGMAALLSDAAPDGAVTTVHREVHKLAGAGAIFGYPAVTEAAQAFETDLQDLAASPPTGPLRAEKRAALARRLQALRDAAEPARTPAVSGGDGSGRNVR